MAERWFFSMVSDEFGAEEFGPYDSFDDALAGIGRIQQNVLHEADTVVDPAAVVVRWFKGPYQTGTPYARSSDAMRNDGSGLFGSAAAGDPV